MRIVRELSPGLSLFIERGFPASYKTSAHYRHHAIIGIGGNIGDIKRRFHHLYYYLNRQKGLVVTATAPILQNPPFGYTDQDDFLNSVIEVATSMAPRELLAFLLRVEKHFGRKRSFANAPRTLDLDLIFFDDVKMKTARLTLPHPHWHERESVLIPLHLLGGR
ncbi:MAG: 2-amino-4-hydroxy-6-hydroxymethyldihydropteridine diphosphokinase [Thiovulaceae bacterium]|nr:2-amino-4-hydroxy-6-hydroxymethyldihydropteridine diphosphokinase [Sulfurimonadaceae bacterium]